MADFDKSKFDPKAAAEARKAEMDEITTKLEKGVKDIFTSDGYTCPYRQSHRTARGQGTYPCHTE